MGIGCHKFGSASKQGGWWAPAGGQRDTRSSLKARISLDLGNDVVGGAGPWARSGAVDGAAGS